MLEALSVITADTTAGSILKSLRICFKQEAIFTPVCLPVKGSTARQSDTSSNLLTKNDKLIQGRHRFSLMSTCQL